MRNHRRIYKMAAAAVLAVLSFGACTKTDEKEQDAYRQYGINCMEKGDYDNAVKSFQNALNQSLGKVGEKEIDICLYKAKAQVYSGDVSGALETYDAVINYNQNAGAYYLRGQLYFDMGQPEKGLADYKKAIEEDGENYELYIAVYESLSQHEMEPLGQKYLNGAMEIKGKKAEDQLYKGRISYLLGDMNAAVEYLTKAKEEKEPLAAYYLGLAYENAGEKEKADECIQEYIDSGAATSYDLYDLGMKEMENENYKDAVTYFEAGLGLKEVPNHQNLLKSTIAAYEYRGKFKTARKLLKEYLSQYPSDEEAQRESIFLETR